MFAALEQLIIDRLKETMPEGVRVDALREIERVPQMRQMAPAVWVIHDGYEVGAVIPPGNVQQVRQKWVVVSVATSSRGQGDVAEARDRASELAGQVLTSLLGFHLGGGKYLQLTDSTGPGYDGGYCHVPLAFSNAATFKGQM